MKYFNFYMALDQIKRNTDDIGIINLREENIGDREVEVLGAALQDNNTVFYVQLPGQYGTITYDGLMSFAKKIILRKESLVVEANNGQWDYVFRYIEETKRLGQEVEEDKFAKLLPTNVHNVQNDNSTGDLTDSSKPTESLALEKDNVVQEVSMEDNVVQEVSMEDNVAQAVSVVEEIVDKAEEVKEDLVELESTASLVNLESESFNSYPENFATIPSNNIKSEKIKSTWFFGKIFNGFKDTFTSLFNHNPTKDSHSSKDTVDDICVAKDYMLQEDTGVLGHHVYDIGND